MKASAFPKEIIDQDQKNGKVVHDYIKANEALEKAAFEEGLRKIIQENVKGYPMMMKGGRPDEDVVEMEIAQYSTPWFRYFIAYDPAENLAQTQCPVLAINGTLDLQVSNDENLAGIKAGMEQGKNPNYEIKSYKELNHLFQKAKTGNVTEYATIEETINEEVLKDVMNWIHKQ